MKKDKLKSIENEIYLNDYSNVGLLNKSLFRSSVIYGVIVLVLLILSIILHEAISVLSIISPTFFYVIASLFLLISVVSVILTILKDKVNPKITLAYYKIFDFVSFVFMTIVSISFVIMYILTPTTVIGASMNQTLESGDKLLIWHLGYEVEDDDVVIVHVSEKYNQKESLFIKRVVATSGDNVSYLDGYFCVNGDRVQEVAEYEYKEMTSLYNDDGSLDNLVVPSGYSIVLGDNRDNSLDSRGIGLVDNKDILGKAIFRILPFKKIGKIHKDITY